MGFKVSNKGGVNGWACSGKARSPSFAENGGYGSLPSIEETLLLLPTPQKIHRGAHFDHFIGYRCPEATSPWNKGRESFVSRSCCLLNSQLIDALAIM